MGSGQRIKYKIAIIAGHPNFLNARKFLADDKYMFLKQKKVEQ